MKQDKDELVNNLLLSKAQIESHIAFLPYRGSPMVKEIKGSRYLYVRLRELGRETMKYVGPYDAQLYLSLASNYSSYRELRKQLRHVEKDLALLGYKTSALSSNALLNIDFARAQMKASIYDQAVLEGVATTFPQTEQILENGTVSGMTPSDIQKVLNLKHAWEFILEKDIVSYKTSMGILKTINKLVEEGIDRSGGSLRSFPIGITGTSYVPPIPDEKSVKEKIESIVASKDLPIDKGIELIAATMKGQYFKDGNKRTAVIFGNHFLIGKGQGLIIVPYRLVPEFREVLVRYYEGNETEFHSYLKEKCWFKLQKTKQETDMEKPYA